MTTPTGQISLSDVRLEIYGSATGQIDMQDPNVYTLAGKTAGSAISMSDLQGKTWVVFTPAAGSVGDTETYPTNAAFTISCNKTATWTYTQTQSAVGSSVSIASGGSATSITFNLTSQSSVLKTAVWSVTGTASGVSASYTVTLETDPIA